MIEINLLPDVKQEFIRARRMRNTVISFSMLAGIIAGGIVVLLIVIIGIQAGLEANADKTIKTEYATLEGVDGLAELVTIQEQLKHIDSQHENKNISSRLFRVVEVIAPTEGSRAVQFNSVSLILEGGDQTMTIEGSTANGFMAVESMVKAIGATKIHYEQDGELVIEPLALSVSIAETSLVRDGEGQKMGFRVLVNLNQMLFGNKSKQIEAVGPTGRIDVTDSRVGVPESLFVAAPSGGDDE